MTAPGVGTSPASARVRSPWPSRAGARASRARAFALARWRPASAPPRTPHLRAAHASARRRGRGPRCARGWLSACATRCAERPAAALAADA